MLHITPSAIKELKRLVSNQAETDQKNLRIGIKGGGCSGLSYLLDFDATTDADTVLNFEGLEVIVNKAHALYLQGIELEFAEGLNNRGFTFNNPNAKETCGCGSSFAV